MMNDMLPPRRDDSSKNQQQPAKSSAHHAVPHPAAHPFRSPSSVAAAEEQNPATNSASELLPEKDPKKKRSLKEWWRGLSKKQKIWLWIAAALLVIALSVGAYFLFFKNDAPVAQAPVEQNQEPDAPPPPTTVPSTLTGIEVDPSVNDRPTTAVMIENSQDARPQSGLLTAGVVFEAIAEGGITRFVTIFQDTEPDYIGPVRSVRPYYIQWALGFDAAIAHAGGSAEALQLLQTTGAKDLNHHSSYFWRVSNRTAPHNLYTSMAKLREYEASKGYGKANYTGFVRKPEAKASAASHTKIDMNISSANFKVHYDYDPATNNYLRSIGGVPHKDEKTGAQLSPKVVVALIVPRGQNGIYSTYQVIGSGQVRVFQDGLTFTGTWRKDANSSQIVFSDEAGNPLKLNPGQTWLTALASADQLSYAP